MRSVLRRMTASVSKIKCDITGTGRCSASPVLDTSFIGNAMEGDVSGDESGSLEPRQDMVAHRDGYVAGHDLHVHVHESPPHIPSAPTPAAGIWGGVPARNPAFTGRAELLGALRGALRGALASAGPVAVQALRGMGGVGKTQIAIEYAHRFSAEYEVVWWLNAENATLLGEQFASLAVELGCSDLTAPLDAVRPAVLGELHRRSRWLLIFDNAARPDDIRSWLPGGAGHVLITSRSGDWAEVAVPVEVDVLARAESVAIVRDRVAGLSERDAALVGDAVGDLPLAVAQAASYLSQTRMPAGQYVALLRTRAAELLSEGKPPSYPGTLAAVTRLAYDRLRAQDEQAADIAEICAFLAPEPVPAQWFTRRLAGSVDRVAAACRRGPQLAGPADPRRPGHAPPDSGDSP